MPKGRFDLIMLSEVLYYFETSTLDRLAARLRPACMPGADLVLVHWLGPTPDYPQTGNSAVEAFIATTADWAEVMQQERRKDFRLDVLRAVRG